MATVTATELSIDSSLEQFKEQFNVLRSDVSSVTLTSLGFSNSITFEGSTVDDFETTLTVVDPTADRTVSLPDASTTLIGASTTDTLTNKTVNLSSNTLTGTTAQFNTALSDGSFATLAGSETLTNKTLTTPVISSISNTGTLTLPTSTDTLVGRATTDTLTNKTLTSPVISSISNTGTLTLPTSTDTLVGRATTDTLTNKTLTSPTVSGLVLSDSSIVIEGSTANDFETTLTVTDPTADRTITFPDATGTVAFTTSTVSTATLASTVTVSDSTANTNFPVVFHDESNALLDDTGALRYNPSTGTLLVPNLTVSGTTTQVDTITMNAANAIVFEGATADDFETTLTITDPTADRTITMPDATGTMALTSDITLSTLSITAAAADINRTDVTTLGTVEASKVVTADANADVSFADDDKIIMGAGSDLQIYHDGTNSYVRDAGTGNLRFTSDSEVVLAKHNNEFMVRAIVDGAVSLYHDNSEKLETTSAGITVTGTVTATAGSTLLIKDSSGSTLKTVKGIS
tara:strand:- start:392 stop:1951 length:1560 start_codon:yes stop_codon:yes gene_type:complete